MDGVTLRNLCFNFRDHLFDLLGSRLMRHGITLGLAALAGLILWSMLPRHSKALEAAAQPQAVVLRRDMGLVAQEIAGEHLFGIDAAAAQTRSPVAQAANINVQGLLYSEDKGTARAILEVNGRTDVFKTGDTLPDGEKLAAIGITAVELGNSRALRTIELQKSNGAAASGIYIAGVNLAGANDPFPGSALAAPGAAFVQHLQTVSPNPNSNPLTQMHSLRQQLITH